MKLVLTILSFSLMVIGFSCQNPENGTYKYKELQFDTTKIAIFKWDSLLYTFPKYSESLLLTNDDIKIVDSLLIDAIDTFNKNNSKDYYEAFNRHFPIDSFTIRLPVYKRQYFPYKDNNGQRTVYIVCFSTNFNNWKSKIYHGSRHSGISTFRLRINLSDKKSDDFSIEGYG